MISSLSIAIVLMSCTTCLATLEVESSTDQLDTAKARQSAVEQSLIAEAWAEGHAFGLHERMSILDVPGVSVAVIHNGQLDWAAGYGVRDETSGLPVTTETVFQAASISKPVAALVTMRIAQDGQIDLDAPIQDYLVSFQLPESNQKGDVTPRRILNHTAGLNVSGFRGYQIDEPIPTAPQLLSGEGNSDALEQIRRAGSRYSYSGGGSTMLQVALSDITGQDFNTLAQRTVLKPLGMTRSTYEQPLSQEDWPNHSAAHDYAGRRITGGFHVYPEQFPAGLWTTPSDLTKFVLEIQQLSAGMNGEILTSKWGDQMLTPADGRAALGLFINEYDGEKWFSHSGSNLGFKCDFRASFEGGHGVIVMTNGETGYDLSQDIIRAVAKVYQWPDMIPDPLDETRVSKEQLERYVGDYAYGPDEIAFIRLIDDRLMVQQLPYPQMPLAPLGDDRFQIIGTEFHIDFNDSKSKKPESMSMSFAPGQHAKRLSPDESWPVQSLIDGDAEAAVNRYRKMQTADPENPVIAPDRLSGMVVSLMKYNQPNVARAFSRGVTEMHPVNARAWDALGQANSTMGDHEAARKAYEECLRRITQDPLLDQDARNQLKEHTRARISWLEKNQPHAP